MKKNLSLFNLFYERLFKINDSPQKIALGLGLGVFAGILPGTGPLAALFLAFIFRANRASALLGSLATNTWISFVTFVLAIKIGSAILGVSWLDVQAGWQEFINTFGWGNLLKHSVLEIVFPVAIGYLLVSFSLGVIVYIISWGIVKGIRKANIKKEEIK
jgi:uncharacterized protein (DUF2062 family)